jgi:hypothetical protein
MAEFRDVLTASAERLVQLFYRVKPMAGEDFLKKINAAAAQLDLNHTHLVCALGFNKHIRDLTDILSVVGFSSYKLLTYRRNELFSTDTYSQLGVDNVLDIYTERIEDEDILETLRGLLAPRFRSIEKKIQESSDPATVMSYKMEIHSVYAGGIATREFAESRVAQAIGELRLMTDEIDMIVKQELIPAGNLFFLDSLLPAEKKILIDEGAVSDAMIRNRLQNREISDAERDMLENFI